MGRRRAPGAMRPATPRPAPTPPVTHTPVVHNLLLCDHARHDAATGKWDISGMFEFLSIDPAGLTGEPLAVDPFDIVVVLSGLHGPIEIGAQMIDPEGRLVGKWGLGALIHAYDPYQRLTLGFRVIDATVRDLGKHTIELGVNGRVIHAAPVWVVAEGDAP